MTDTQTCHSVVSTMFERTTPGLTRNAKSAMLDAAMPRIMLGLMARRRAKKAKNAAIGWRTIPYERPE